MTKNDDGSALAPAIAETVTSSNAAVASYDGTKIVAHKAGPAEFTFKFKGIAKEYKLKVTVKAARTATSIANKNVKVEVGTEFTWENYIVVLDQYGDVMKTPTPTITVEVNDLAPTEGKTTVSPAGKYTVAVYAGATEIGKFTVEAVEVKATDPISYKLVFADPDKTEFGYSYIPTAGFAPATLLINVEVYAKGDVLRLPSFAEAVKPDEFVVESSDDKVATVALAAGVITVTPVKLGKVTITLYKVSGDMQTPVQSIDVLVKDITPQIKKLVLKDGVNALVLTEKDGVYTVKNENEGDLVITDPTKPEITFSNALVKSIDYNETAGIAVITLKDVFGGKAFTFKASIAAEAA